eukprot:g43591.t1
MAKVTDEEDNQAPPLPPPFPAPKNSGSHLSKKANVNVVSVNLGKLVDISNVQSQAVKAIYCQRCSAALSSISRIHQKYADIIWPCEFCNKRNVVTRSFNTIPTSQDVMYLSGFVSEDYINVDDSLVVFCIDVSGSMCATNERKLEHLEETHVDTRRICKLDTDSCSRLELYPGPWC